ncbi:MAG: hypothetical protein AMS18_06285 [Gemmatimonas sp. SG8_17]|nr:MAG: hypothetical protein AMS18_06285 [Gemmatimonas sp. SG8_17]
MTETGCRHFFLPGPTEVHSEVLAAMARPMIPHRGQEMVDLLTEADQQLRKIFRTERPAFIGTCTATGFMEMAVRCGVRRRALCLINGAYGERFAAIVAATGREAIRLNVPRGRTVEPDMLEDALQRSDVDAVTLVHSETSTGALAPLQDLAEVVQQHDGVVLLVDGVSSVAGSPVETDAWSLDFVFTGSQEALGLPPGLAFAVASERMAERAKKIPERGAYLDLLAFTEAAADHQPTNTPAIPLLYALRFQLERIAAAGGVEAWWDRHEAMLRTVEAWVDGAGGAQGFSYLPCHGRRSWTVSCLRVPDGRNGRECVKGLLECGWAVGTGYGELRDETIRIGHMGDHSAADVSRLLEAVDGLQR